MRGALIKSCCLWALLASPLLIPAASAFELDHSEDGFRVSVPDDFVRDSIPKDSKTLHLYREPVEPGSPNKFISIQQLDGTIPVGWRVNPSKVETEKGATVSFDRTEWQTHPLDVIKTMGASPEGIKVALYSVRFPTSPKAIQLTVGGPVEKDTEIRALFDKTVAGFISTNPLVTKSEYQESAKSLHFKLGELFARLAIWGLVAFVFIRMLVRIAGGKKKKPKQGTPQAGPPVVRRPR